MTDGYVTFRVADETYAVPAHSVREVIRWSPPTRVPHSRPAVKGVINLRGEIVMVLDLRVELGLPSVDPTDRTCIVVVNISRPHGRVQVGLIVDTALEVARVTANDRESTSSTASLLANGAICGVARIKGALIMLLDVERLTTAGLLPQAIEA